MLRSVTFALLVALVAAQRPGLFGGGPEPELISQDDAQEMARRVVEGDPSEVCDNEIEFYKWVSFIYLLFMRVQPFITKFTTSTAVNFKSTHYTNYFHIAMNINIVYSDNLITFKHTFPFMTIIGITGI